MTAVELEQQGSQAVGLGSSLCRAKHFNDFTDISFFNLNITTENRDTAHPLFCMKSFDTRNFLKRGRVPLRNFRHGETFDGKS